MSNSFTIKRQTRWLTLVLLTSVVTSLFAVPPAAPTQMLHQVTRAGFEALNPSSGAIDATGKYICHLLRWRDNALDEEGYDVGMRFGNFGPFTMVARLGPNETEILVPTRGDGDLKPGVPVQFQIIVWKFNGSAMESTTVSFNSTIPPLESKPGFLVATPSTPLAATDRVGEPSNLTVTPLNDGTYRLDWQDNSSSEIYYEIQYGEQLPPAVTGDPEPAVAYRRIGFVNFNTTSFVVSNLVGIPESNTSNSRLTLVPGKIYRFAVRGTRRAPSGITALFNEANPITATEAQIATKRAESAPVTIPSLSPPSELVATETEQRLILSWKDNSNNETGYRIERLIPGSAPASYETVVPENGTTDNPNLGENTSSTAIKINKQRFNEIYRVVALYVYRPQGASANVTLTFPSTGTVSVNGPFAAPTQLIATTSSVGRGVDLTWKDNTLSEVGFDVLTRPANSPPEVPFHFARAVPANMNKVTVTTRSESSDSATLIPVFIPLEAGVMHEFVVRAVGDGETVYSVNSNIASAAAQDGFIGNLFPPITAGVAFTYQVATTNSVGRTSWNVSQLPLGLTFNPSNGVISGTTLEAGLFQCPMTATFGPGQTSQATLTLRVLNSVFTFADSKAPVFTSNIANLTVGIGTPYLLKVASKITDPDAPAAVRLATTKGDLDFILFSHLAPKAVQNFMSYVEGGDYNNLIFHRHVSNFVIQAGSIRASLNLKEFQEVPARSPAINEPGISNVAFTIAAAKLGARNSTANILVNGVPTTRTKDESFGYVGNPDSATSDFFINLSNNNTDDSTLSAANLDTQNSGFTAFGRVSLQSQSVVSTIRSLPVGNYGTGIFASLPVDAATAPSSATPNQTVRITKATPIPPLSISVDNQSPQIATVIPAGNDLLITGLREGTRSVTLSVRDLDGHVTPHNFTITVKRGHVAPTITRQPANVAVVSGAAAVLSVGATGSSLSYQWRRNGTLIENGKPNYSGQNTSTLRILSTGAGDIGEYDVLVSNATAVLTSTLARVDIRTAPDITNTLPAQVVEVGKALELTATVTGFPSPTFVWRRGTTALSGQTTRQFRLSSVKLTDGGLYKATATNIAGSDASNDIPVCVLNSAASLQVIKPGTITRLTAPVSGPWTTFVWKKDGIALPISAPGYSGQSSPVLTVNTATGGGDGSAFSGDYLCEVTAPNGLGQFSSGVIRLAVSQKPVLTPMTGLNQPGFGAVGANYLFQIPYTKSNSNTPTKFTITGLPPGLSFDSAQGIIFGRPTRAGNFTISVFAENPAGDSKPATPGTIVIRPMGSQTVGTFLVSIDPSSLLNANKGGRLDLTVTDTSAYSAKLLLGSESYTLAGNMNLAGSTTLTNGIETNLYQSQLAFKRKSGAVHFLNLIIVAGTGEVGGLLSDGLGNEATLSGYRQIWHSIRNPGPASINSTCNLGLHLQTQDRGVQSVPQGSGYLQMTTGSSGMANFAGRLADGTVITTSSIVGRNRQVLLHQMINNNLGSIRGSLDMIAQVVQSNFGFVIVPERVLGTVRWIKDGQVTPFERNYGTGIRATTLDLRGALYTAPVAPRTVIGPLKTPTSAGVSAVLDFSEGGIQLASRNPDIPVSIRPLNLISRPTGDANLAKTTLAVNSANGLFNGLFELKDGSIQRNVTYQGLMIPPIGQTTIGELIIPASSYLGVGYFTLDQLPVAPATDFRVTPRLSGRVVLAATSVLISPQPQARTVNPGASVTFNVGTTETGTITYQWRKNGVVLNDDARITGTKSDTLSINSVVESDQATYDCIVDNVTTFTASDGALLSVNDPVSQIVVSRTPADEFISDGTAVQFTASSAGTPPFTYQWQKNGTPITNATASQYNIPSASSADNGTYTVLVSNIVSTNILSASASTLKVVSGITNVVATRSPSAEFVPTGTTVTFSVTADGTGPFNFQWFKDNAPITGANLSSLIINSVALADAGTYKVKLSNELTTEVFSSNLVLRIADPVTSVTVSKSYPSQAITPNTSVTFSVTAEGTPTLTYQWRKNGIAIEGATNSSFTTTSGAEPNFDNPDIYDVLVFNDYTQDGQLSSPIPLRVALPITDAVASRSPPSEFVIDSSGPIVFSVVVDGSGPYQYVWRKNGFSIEGANSATYTITQPIDDVHDGVYDCVITNPLHSGDQNVISNSVPLVVIPPP